MPIQKLFDHFGQYLPLDDLEKEHVARQVSVKQVKRRQLILQEGDICRHYNFVAEGCLKMYSVDQKGVAHNLQFAAENDWITDIGSFYAGKPSLSKRIPNTQIASYLGITPEFLSTIRKKLASKNPNFR